MIKLGSSRCPANIIGYDYDASVDSATSFASPPTGATAVLVQATAQALRVTCEGTTPTATVGTLVPVASDGLLITGDIAKLKVIAATSGAAASLTYLSQ